MTCTGTSGGGETTGCPPPRPWGTQRACRDRSEGELTHETPINNTATQVRPGWMASGTTPKTARYLLTDEYVPHSVAGRQISHFASGGRSFFSSASTSRLRENSCRANRPIAAAVASSSASSGSVVYRSHRPRMIPARGDRQQGCKSRRVSPRTRELNVRTPS